MMTSCKQVILQISEVVNCVILKGEYNNYVNEDLSNCDRGKWLYYKIIPYI